MSLTFDLVSLVLVVLGGLLGILMFSRRRREHEQRDALALAQSREQNRHIPPTLHPVIDPDACIGSLSCLRVCPEGDVLGVVNGRATLIDAAACIGHGKCALECPVEAIKLVFGTSERGLDLPEVSEDFESSRRGVFVIGELGGMGLIKNAIEQGQQMVEAVAKVLARAGPSTAGVVDLAIVGGGPAGLSAALSARAKGLSFRVLEQETLGGTIAHYPRQKIVMTERVEMPFIGKFGKTLISKEELLASWQKALQKADIKINTGVKVESISGEDNSFQVKTNRGVLAARKVVLAIGRRGTPRKMGVPGEELPKVSYRLDDPEQYDEARVLVVGGGDSALEAAIQLAEESHAQVTLSYRNPEFGKCRDANKRKFRELVEKKRITALMASSVMNVSADAVTLQQGEKELRVANDFVLVCIGGELPSEFLKQAGVTMKRYHGEEKKRRGAGSRAPLGSVKRLMEERRERRMFWALTFLGVAIIGWLLAAGWEYYPLSRAERIHSPLHAQLKPAGTWGHGIGIVATAVMMSNFLYALRKRWRRMKGTGPIRQWLTFHQFVGFMSPLVIAFHAAFQSNNLLATSTAVFLAIVVATGVLGRFIFGLVPTADGRVEEQSALSARFETLRSRLTPLTTGAQSEWRVRALVDRLAQPMSMTGFGIGLLSHPFEVLRLRAQVRSVARFFPSVDEFKQFSDAYLKLMSVRFQMRFYQGLRNLMSVWRSLHVVLAILLVVMISVHIGVSLYLGYKWILR